MTAATPRNFEFRRFLDLFSTPTILTNGSSIPCNASVKFQMKIRKIGRRRSRSSKYRELIISRCCLTEDRLQNAQRFITHVESIARRSLNLQFGEVFVAVAVVVYFSFLLKLTRVPTRPS